MARTARPTLLICLMLLSSRFASGQSAPAPAPATRLRPQMQQAQTPPARSPSEAMQRAGGSLLRATVAVPPDPNQAKLEGVSFFAVPEPTPRTLKKHDLVTIVIREESSYKSEGSTDLKKESSLEAKLDEFIKLSLANVAIGGGAQGANPPSIKASAARDFKGEASVDRTDSLVLRVTGEVIDVKPNGTLVLQARQHIKTDEEEQTFVLSGICRAEDVTPDNTVLSTQMFDKELTKSHKGAVRDTTKRGFIPKLLDAINPF
jgi:flagellar L-ring protein precursor FlgH